MAESLLVRAQSAGESFGTQLGIGQALQGSVMRSSSYVVNGSSMLMAAVKVYNGVYGGWKQVSSADWFIVVVGDIGTSLPIYMVTSTGSTTYLTQSPFYATMTTSKLTIAPDPNTSTSTAVTCSVSGRVFCTV